MRAVVLAAAILAFSAMLAPAGAQNNAEPRQQTRDVTWEEQISGLLEAQHQYADYGGAGFEDWVAPLFRNRRVSITYRLEARVSYRVTAVCDEDCTDVDLEAFDSSRTSVAIDQGVDDHPYLDITPLRSDTFTIDVWVVQCSREPCYAGVRLLRRGADARGGDVAAAGGIATGTGFLISRDGLVVTNHHVVEDATSIAIVFGGRAVPATVVTRDPANDVVILRAAVTGRPLALASSRASRRGDEVMTLGYPLPRMQGQAQKAAFGRINALSGLRDDARFMQVDIPIQPGNSGGPLLNARGEVIGIITSTIDQADVVQTTGGALAQNVNYAVKSEYIAPLLPASISVSGGSQTVGPNFSEIASRLEASVFLIVAAIEAGE